MRGSEYVWTPTDYGALAGLRLTKAAYDAYAVALKFADRRTGFFVLSKNQAAAHMARTKRTADAGFAQLVASGILVSHGDRIRDHRQLANGWTLRPSHLWRLGAAVAKARLAAILERLRNLKVAKAERLQLLRGAISCSPVPQQSISGGSNNLCMASAEAEAAQIVARRALQEGFGRDYMRQQREIDALLTAQATGA